MAGVDIERLSETDWLVRLGDTVDAGLNAHVQQLATHLRASAPEGLVDIVPAYASVLLRGDAALATLPGEALPPPWRAVIDAMAVDAADTVAGREHRIPVCYGGEHGQDLAAVAGRLGLDADELVRRHTAAEYRVAMLGFAPGFTYLLGLDPALAVPRHDTPRTRVPAGSIGLAGAQTGVYPRALPGGWQLIGRTPLQLAPLDDPQRPCLLAPGDRVRFEAIGPAAFARLAAEQGDD